ncbi:MAG: hypothetical protein ACIAXF_10795 [Phycisphaerales bacterium JB063]
MSSEKIPSTVPPQSGVARLWPVYRGLQWMPVLATMNIVLGLAIYMANHGASFGGFSEWFAQYAGLILMGAGFLLLALCPIYWQLRRRDLLIRELLAELESRGVIGNDV